MSNQDRHHIWCNFFMGPREGCRQCADLYARFPIQEGQTGESLAAKHFPNAVIIPRQS